MGENKKVLVTGSSRGIGREIALFLAKNGFDIDVHYAHNKEKAQEVLDQLNNDWDGEVDDCIAYGFNTKMFDSLVYHLNFQLYD